ncbi:MAG TPA: hypothetical protein VFB38_20495 [Chthonomonadaceae bacterium]|nr:hypothetical protein [Chthonomonadaceae bacterium]
MKTQSPDTHPKIEKLQIEGYRRMSAAEKLKIVHEMTEFVTSLALSDVKQRHPEADERECRLRLASRWLDAELMKKAFGWDVKEKGY